MTRKDFVLIAGALKSARVTNHTNMPNRALYLNGVDNAAHMIAAALADTNPNFDKARFLLAAGVES